MYRFCQPFCDFFHEYISLSRMGNCFKSSNSNALSHVDDSVKVMIQHDAKALEKKGQKPGGYVPRAPHPILDNPKEASKVIAATESEAVEEVDLGPN